MGSCCSVPRNNDIDNNSKKTLNGTPPPPIRKGAEGLLELGLEYRCLPCSKHVHQQASATNDNSTDTTEHCKSKPTPLLHCLDCSHRIYLLQENGNDILVTTDNRKKHIPGRIYDPAAKAAQEEVVEWMKRDFGMKELPLFSTNTDDSEKECKEAIVVNALVTTKQPHNDPNKGTLIIMNGRGVARAGILSTRHTFESGVEKGSAAVHIHEARQRNMAVVCLDSNAQGSTKILESVCQSLDSPALVPYLRDTPLYFLCHSAAGGNLVQYLLRTTTTSRTPSFSLDQIRALVFTDSTHDLQWLSLQKNPNMVAFLQSPTCLYIRNNREHVGDTFGPNHKHQAAGDPYNTSRDQHWKKRFGDIRTVYAGTTDHSLMCYQARHVIWEFFDSKLPGIETEKS